MKKMCFCGLNLSYEDCCGRFIDGIQNAHTPEELMRSRYSAYVQANMNYIARTMQGNAAAGFDPVASQKWAQSIQWLNLTIFDSYKNEENKKIGYVKFQVRYKDADGVEQHLAEISEFRKINGQWYYTDGKITEKNNNTVYTKHSLRQKPGRNDTCHCGSGKKFKKCCNLKQWGENQL